MTPYVGDMLAYAIARFTDGPGRYRGVPDVQAVRDKIAAQR